MIRLTYFSLFLFILSILLQQVHAEFQKAIIVVNGNNGEEEAYCIGYVPELSPLPVSKKAALSHPLKDLRNWTACYDVAFSFDQSKVKGNVVLISDKDCSLQDKANVIHSYEGRGLIVEYQSLKDVQLPPSGNYININLSITLMDHLTAQNILTRFGTDFQVTQFAFQTPRDGWDPHYIYSLLLIFLLALACITIGGFWGGIINVKLIKPIDIENTSASQEASAAKIICSLIYVSAIIGTIVLLYYFYNYIVYVFIALFCIGALFGVNNCLEPLVERIPFGDQDLFTLKTRFSEASYKVQPRFVVLFAFSLGIVIWWLVIRNELHAWILQDILGVAFNINIIRTTKIPSLKFATILLVGFFLYDIFALFVTPLFTASGNSILIEIIGGGSSRDEEEMQNLNVKKEHLPVVFRVPYFLDNYISVCTKGNYVMLGYGDTLIPGIFGTFCHTFDLAHGKKKIYFSSFVLGYAIGLIFTFSALYGMGRAQPALLYLVPCTLVPIFLVSLYRKQFLQIWKGQMPYNIQELVEEDASHDNDRSCSSGAGLEEEKAPSSYQNNANNLENQTNKGQTIQGESNF